MAFGALVLLYSLLQLAMNSYASSRTILINCGTKHVPNEANKAYWQTMDPCYEDNHQGISASRIGLHHVDKYGSLD